MCEFKNQRFYSLCRHNLDKKPATIYEEVKDLFNLKFITISQIYSWTHQYRSETNKYKRSRLFEFDPNDTATIKNLRFEIKNLIPNNAKHILFYALCRIQLNQKLTAVYVDLNQLFGENTPDFSVLRSWINDCWRHDYTNLDEIVIRANLECNLNSFYELVKENVTLASNYRLLIKRIDILESSKKSYNNISDTNNNEMNKENLRLREELTKMDTNLKMLENLLNEEKLKNANLLLELNNKQAQPQINDLNDNNQMLKLAQSEAHIEQLKNELKLKQDEIIFLNNEKRFLIINQCEQYSNIQMNLKTSTEKINELQNKNEYYRLLAEKSIQKSGLLNLENERLISMFDQYKNEKEDSNKKLKRNINQESKRFELVDLTRIEDKVNIILFIGSKYFFS
jgi:hypothetical protein